MFVASCAQVNVDDCCVENGMVVTFACAGLVVWWMVQLMLYPL